jgi:hypothetical protein
MEAEDLIAAVRERHSLRALRIMAGGQAFLSVPYRGQEIGTDGVVADAGSAVIMANRLVDPRRL